MKKTTILTLGALAVFAAPLSFAGEESKTWPASEEAQKFVADSIVIGFLASPWGAGWTNDKHLHDYFQRARDTGITGHSMTLAAASHTWEDYLAEHHKWRSTMAQTPEKFTYVRSIRDIETAHIRGTTAVIWNSQTSTILNGDLSKVATLKEMGIGSMILVYNDLFRAGSGSLAEFNGTATGVTPWGLAIIDEMVEHGIIVDLSHMGPKTTNGIMDYMEEKYPGVPFVFTHSLPAGLYKDTPEATDRGCYRNISDEEAIRAAKSGGYVSPTFTEWMMDGIWPDDIAPEQAADMIDYYVKLLGEDHVGLATDDMYDVSLVVDFAKKNATMYNDGGYMIDAFNKGADDAAMMARFLPAVTDELWKRGYTNEQLVKIYGANKMRVYQQVWEGAAAGQWDEEYQERVKLRKEFMEKFNTR